MKKFYLLFLLGGVMFLCGCQSQLINTGMYLPKDGGDEYVVVYKDMIFMHVLRPDTMTGVETYWDWAGKYKINYSGELEFDMSGKEQKDWKFYYVFRPHASGGIMLEDLSVPERSHVLVPRPVQRRKVVPMEQQIQPMQ